MEKLKVTEEREKAKQLQRDGTITNGMRLLIWDFISLHNALFNAYSVIELQPQEQSQVRAFYSLCEGIRINLPIARNTRNQSLIKSFAVRDVISEIGAAKDDGDAELLMRTITDNVGDFRLTDARLESLTK